MVIKKGLQNTNIGSGEDNARIRQNEEYEEWREVEGETEREKLSGADPLIPLQGSRDTLVQTQTLFSPPPPFILYFLSFLASRVDSREHNE